MRRTNLLITAFSIAVLLATPITTLVVLAQASGGADADTFVTSGALQDGLNHNSEDLLAAASAPPGQCNVASTIYMKWDLSAISSSSTVQSAALTLTVLAANHDTAGAQLTLYRLSNDGFPNDDGWSETGLNSDLALAASLSSIALPTLAAGQTVQFYDDGTGAPGLAAYIDSQTADADDWVTLVVRMTGCATAAGSLPTLEFGDGEGAPGTPDSTPPDLTMWPGSNQTPVTFSSFRAAGGAGFPLIWAGLVLPLAAAVGLVLYRRRKPGA